MKVKCPTCRRLTDWEQNPQRPFCSERCRLLDLGAWINEEFVISSQLTDESETEIKDDED